MSKTKSDDWPQVLSDRNCGQHVLTDEQSDAMHEMMRVRPETPTEFLLL